MKFSDIVLLASLFFVSDVSIGYLDSVSQQPGSIKRLIIDTDAGVDDAVAIFNILGAEKWFKNVKIEFITTVAGNTHVSNVGRNVLKILKTARRLDIPIFRGANGSILFTPEVGFYFGKDGFGDIDFPNPPSEDLIKIQPAAYSLIEAAAANPGQLILVCLGPLTNIALAARLDPKFISNLKDIFVIGGSDSGLGNIKPGIEFNFYVDPEAAFIALKEAEKNKKLLNLLTLETVCTRSVVEMIWRKEILATIKSREVELINKAEKLTLQGEKWICADGMLSAVVLNDDLVQDSAIYHVDVEHCGQYSRGSLFIDYDNAQNLSRNVRLIKKIKVDMYKRMLMWNLNPQDGLSNGAGRTV